MIKNLWKQITIVCGHHPDSNVEFVVKEGVGHQSDFYACPKYYPDNREEGETACLNHVRYEDLECIVIQISDKLEESLANGCQLCLTGKKWNWRTYHIRIKEHRSDEIVVSLINTKQK